MVHRGCIKSKDRRKRLVLPFGNPHNGNPIITKLDNGATIIGQEVPGIDTAIVVAIPYGLADDIVRSHLLEHLIFRSRPHQRAQNADERIENLGGFYTGYTELDKLVLIEKVLDLNKREALELLCESLTNPYLSERALTREKRIVIGELQETRSEPTYRLNEAVYRTILEDHTLDSEEETISRIREVKLEELVAIKQRYFGARNLHVGIAGPDVRETLAHAKETIGHLPQKGRRLIRHKIPKGRHIVRTYRKEDFDDCVITIAAPVPGYGSEEIYAILLIENMLAGSVPEYETRARLWKTLRDREGIIYHADSLYSLFNGAGILEVSVSGVMERNVGVVRQRIIKELERLRRYPTSEQELAAAKDSLLIHAHRREGRSPEDVAENLAVVSMSGGNPSYREYVRGLNEVTPIGIKTAANKYLSEDRLFIGTLRKAA